MKADEPDPAPKASQRARAKLLERERLAAALRANLQRRKAADAGGRTDAAGTAAASADATDATDGKSAAADGK